MLFPLLGNQLLECCNLFIGLSKERPILDHHAKAHILDFMKSGGFRTDFMKSGGFHTDFTPETRRISHMKDQLPGMVSPYVLFI